MAASTKQTTNMLVALIGMRQRVWLLWWSMLCIASFTTITMAEHVCELEVSEGVPIGYQIGYIGEFLHGVDSGPPYLIVPVQGSAVEPDLSIDHTTGEIRTKVLLDRETRATYSFVAIPMSGENIKVLIRVLDENDNSPTFPAPSMNIEFPENTPRDVKRTLNPARDADLGRYNTQRYNIVSGNVNNAFRLSSHRERDGVLYLDLQINGFLDRETTPFYSLVIEAIDGGNPPLRGQMTVNISIQDVNDNTPIFNQSRYFASVPENATIGTKVLQVYATDIDAGNNGLIAFSINRRQSDREQMFQIDSKTGIISVNKPLDFETKELHELVVVARDHGEQPLETTAFVSISVTNVNDNQPIINVIFLSDDATPKISESAQPGEFVARISVNDPDSKTEYSNVNVSLIGGDGHFGLTTRDSIIYLVIISLPLDREVQPNYTLSIVATDQGNPPLHASKTIYLKVTDCNDNAPEFEKEIYHANVMEVADPGTSVLQVAAIDRDDGNNSVITYSILDTPNTHSDWFQIDQNTGLITTRSHIDCETEPVPQLIVQARDNGIPSMTSTATVFIQIHDVNDNEPIFDQSFYNATVSESDPKGKCILKEANKAIKFYKGIIKEPEHGERRTSMTDYGTIKENQSGNDEIVNDATTKLTLRDFFTPEAKKACFISFTAITLSYFRGIYVILAYVTEIFTRTGSSLSPKMSSLLVSITSLLGNFVFLAIVEQFNRRTFYIGSSIFTALSFFLFSIYCALWLKQPEYEWMPTLFFVCIVFGSCVGLMAIPYTISIEVFPKRIRPVCLAIAISLEWIILFIVAAIFPISLKNIGLFGSMMIFGVVCLLNAIFGIFFIPETRGKSHEEIMELLTR